MLPDGGSIEIGFYHEPCHFTNYKGGYVEIPQPYNLADNERESRKENSVSMTCGRCGKEFTFEVANDMSSGLWILEEEERIPQEDIFYRNLVDEADKEADEGHFR